jgi:hypothetical protein
MPTKTTRNNKAKFKMVSNVAEQQAEALRTRDIRIIKMESIRACPHYIMTMEHYRADGSCRCNDQSHTEMEGWGYEWVNGRWESPPGED